MLSRARLTCGEVAQAIRSSGCGDLEMIAAVVLETDGSLSVVTADRCRTASAMPPHIGVPSGHRRRRSSEEHRPRDGDQ